MPTLANGKREGFFSATECREKIWKSGTFALHHLTTLIPGPAPRRNIRFYYLFNFTLTI